MRTRTPERTPAVDPSARDPIGSWLDVFVALLALPRHERQTIRDELEDHLRSRVDDLIITGIEEHEAVRRAVAELGETAQLARSFRAAARHTHTTRRLIMTGTLFTAVGAGLVIGVAAITGGVNPGVVPNTAPGQGAGEAQAAAVPAEDAGAKSLRDPIGVRGKTYAELFETVREIMAPKPVLIHWDRLEHVGIRPEEPVAIDADRLSFKRVKEILANRTMHEFGDAFDTYFEPAVYEITTRSHMDQRTRRLATYDVREVRAMIAATHPEGFDVDTFLLDAFRSVCSRRDWMVYGGTTASARVTGNTLFVDAPERIQYDVNYVLEVLERDQFETARRAEEKAAEHRDGLVRRKGELEKRLDRLAGESSRQDARIQAILDTLSDREPRERAMQAAEDTYGEQARLLIERDLTRARIEQVKDAILTIELEQMADGGDVEAAGESGAPAGGAAAGGEGGS